MLNLLMKRRSIRQYTEQPIERPVLEMIIQSALLAPSSKNTKPWSFVVVEDKKKLSQLASAREPASTFLPKAQAAIVVLADGSKSDVWVEDCSIASVLMQLTATDLGLGSCWVQVRNRASGHQDQSAEDYIRQLLGVPNQFYVEAIITLGYPAEEKRARDLAKLDIEKVFKEEFGQGYF